MTESEARQLGQLPNGIDSDYAWLKAHLDLVEAIDARKRPFVHIPSDDAS
jgi:hypothetical protein